MGVDMKECSSNLKTKKKNERGMATIEALPLIVIFVVLMSYGLGMYGVIHTAVLQSIAARTYTFETFRNRTNLTMFRENLSGLSYPQHTKHFQMRFHAVLSDSLQNATEFYATERPLAIGRQVAQVGRKFEVHNLNIFNLKPRNQTVEVNPIWIMVGYGICLDAHCGD